MVYKKVGISEGTLFYSLIRGVFNKFEDNLDTICIPERKGRGHYHGKP